MTFSGGIFPTQGSNLDLLHCRWFLYCLSHQGSSQTEGEVKTEFCGNHGTNQKELRARGFYFHYELFIYQSWAPEGFYCLVSTPDA